MEPIQPIVLAGGRSTRFGRDKLREPIEATKQREVWLIDRPIAALREVFGARVAVVGHCDPRVAERADLVIPDAYPGVGPAGGILSALEHGGGSVCVLAGDMPAIDAQVVRSILKAGNGSPAADAVVARTDRIEPCIGLYRSTAAAALRSGIEAGANGRVPSLRTLIRDLCVVEVAIDPRLARNVNTPGELGEGAVTPDRSQAVDPIRTSANRG